MHVARFGRGTVWGTNTRRRTQWVGGHGAWLDLRTKPGASGFASLRALLLIGLAVALMTSSNSGASPKFSGWSTPTNLGPVVNSPFEDGGPAISKDGLSLFFGSGRPGGSGAIDLYVAQRASVDDLWGSPMNLGPTVNTGFDEVVPALSRDGHWLFFNSNRPGGFGLIDIFASYREHVHDDFDWQTPANLGSGVNSAFVDAGAGYFENDDLGLPLLFFTSNRPGGPGGFDIYVSAQLPDGSWGAAGVVTELSSPANDQRPSLRFDGLEVFLNSNRAGGFGLFDIWVSTRDSTSDPWTPPLNLGPTVNSAFGDLQAYIAADRETLYFASSRPGGLGALDLYVTTRLGPGA